MRNACFDRRRFVKAVGAGLALTSVGCTPTGAIAPAEYPRVYSRNPWAAPRVSMNAVIRVVVGHRPYRKTGFRVEREYFDNKAVIHNYGHGGGGLSLGWGSSALAVRNTLDLEPGDVAVMGSGIMGLCSARLLQDAGWNVTIYTRDPYRHTTSNISAGEWAPFATHEPEFVAPSFIAQLDWAARVSHHAYTNMTGARYGIRWLETYQLWREQPSGTTDPTFNDLFSYQATLAPGEHPFGAFWAKRMVTMQIDPGTLMRQLIVDYRQAGGNFVVRNFANLDDVMALPENVIFNCTGLGAASLFDDADLAPAKGQLVFIPPDPAVDYMTIGGGRGLLHMFPRGDVLLMGGIFKPGDSSSNVEAAETERIVEEHRRLFDEFG